MAGRPIHEIEIPIIQRDFAQGRRDDETRTIRDRFVDAIVDAITSDRNMGLDFIYGDVKAGVLRPLDGQQRLTTLFLLHWYVASLADELQPDWLGCASHMRRGPPRATSPPLSQSTRIRPMRRAHPPGSRISLGTSTPGGKTRRSPPCS